MNEKQKQNIDYLNNSVFAKLGPSKIHGIGVFAIRDIPKGQYLKYKGFIHNNFIDTEIEAKYFKLIKPCIRELIMDRWFWERRNRDIKKP